MKDPLPENEYRLARGVFRSVGFFLLAFGGLFLIIGFVDFFSAAGAMRTPRHFWMLFIAGPMLAIGAGMIRAGFAGKIARYFGREYGPAVSKTFNEIARDSREGIGVLTEAIRTAPDGMVANRLCPDCGHANDFDAKFCAACGQQFLVTITCPDCGEPADPGARFCDACGRPLGTRREERR